MYDGMINVCKEKGFTSHDVVGKTQGNPSSEENRPYGYAGSGCNRGSAGLSRQRNKAL